MATVAFTTLDLLKLILSALSYDELSIRPSSLSFVATRVNGSLRHKFLMCRRLPSHLAKFCNVTIHVLTSSC
ncbi:hypothetical protein VFPPC_16318 [Pochonia chlamydosporia 170]|uniref:Uncharacterized protein n=1 Tax=Pochonia chlamydosporia 170 TaxID=1380566 RepID=A0A179FHY7_METCM|nr:hypothetical protein VFPPC_16318 [Pochonia chlamydosporia 170]OAQ65245.1 hypothetical protein VFPPC_16318 [Pochonia chlamydosporia 170]